MRSLRMMSMGVHVSLPLYLILIDQRRRAPIGCTSFAGVVAWLEDLLKLLSAI